MKKSKISLFVLLMIALVTVTSTVFAATGSIIDVAQKGSLTITTREQNNGSTATTEAPVIGGVEYTLYRVDSVDGTTVTTVAQAEAAIATIAQTDKKTTGANGVASFTNLNVGRYYAKVTGYPTGTSQVPESFLVNIPTTNPQGRGWIYDITVQPKVKTARGNATLTKKDGDNQVMKNVVFTVQVSTNGGTTWADYTPEGASSVLELTTGDAGTIKLEDFPITIGGQPAYFRFVEKSVPDTEYVIDNSHLDYVYAQADGKTIVVHADGTSEAAAVEGTLTVTNEKPVVTKTVKNDDNSYTEQASASATDTISFNVNATIPSAIENMTTFTLKDELPDGLKDRTNVVVKGVSGTTKTTLATTAYTKTEEGKVLTITFVPAQIKDYDAVEVTYDVKLDMTKAELGEDGNVNTATLNYTNKVNTDGTEATKKDITDEATVLTGGVKIHKVNAENTNLANAKFKIATTEANAKAGTFVKGTDGNDIEVTTGTNGYAEINGLAYEDDGTARDYWLVETESPKYEENGETKAYMLLTAPVKVSVSGTSHTVDVRVVNRKPIDLPLTGGIGTAIFMVAGIVCIVIAKSIKKEEVKE